MVKFEFIASKEGHLAYFVFWRLHTVNRISLKKRWDHLYKVRMRITRKGRAWVRNYWWRRWRKRW